MRTKPVTTKHTERGALSREMKIERRRVRDEVSAKLGFTTQPDEVQASYFTSLVA